MSYKSIYKTDLKKWAEVRTEGTETMCEGFYVGTLGRTDRFFCQLAWKLGFLLGTKELNFN